VDLVAPVITNNGKHIRIALHSQKPKTKTPNTPQKSMTTNRKHQQRLKHAKIKSQDTEQTPETVKNSFLLSHTADDNEDEDEDDGGDDDDNDHDADDADDVDDEADADDKDVYDNADVEDIDVDDDAGNVEDVDDDVDVRGGW